VSVKLLICALLLHGLLFPVYAATQTPPSLDGIAAPVFDSDAALAQSQAAIGTELADVRFTAADGRSLRLSDFRGKPLVLSMVYTSCYQVCPMTTRYLSQVIDKARAALGEDSFAVAVVGFDTRVDTPAAMRYFARQQNVDNRGWYLLSTTPDEIKRLASGIGFVFQPSSHGFDHLIQATVIDAEGRVYRQVYGQVFDTPLLVDPLIELVLGRGAPERPLLDSLLGKIRLFCTTYDPARDGYYIDYSLFIGMLIGGSIIIFTAIVVVRGWRNSRS
jgi:protein SCO1/2